MSIALVDTSVFTNILNVPGFNQDRKEILASFKEYVELGTTFVLPLAAMVETGNHIGQLDDGRVRRHMARRFRTEVRKAIEGSAPFVPATPWEFPRLKDWLDEFPERAKEGLGLADLSIVKEWERLCSLHRARRVFIWSLDGHLNAYDRSP